MPHRKRDPIDDPDLPNLYPTRDQVVKFIELGYKEYKKKKGKTKSLARAASTVEGRKMTVDALKRTIIAYCEIAEKMKLI